MIEPEARPMVPQAPAHATLDDIPRYDYNVPARWRGFWLNRATRRHIMRYADRPRLWAQK